MAVDRVIGLAPTNAVIADLSKDCYARAATVHRELGQLERDPSRWDRKNVVMVDEAGMMDNAFMASLLDARVHEIIRSTLQRMLLSSR
jgi:ATP-dependent exoDNAse (exonuclease V) alpha subunit